MSLIFSVVVPCSIVIGALLAGFLVRNFVFRRLLHWGKISRRPLDDIVIAAISKPFLFWWALFGAYVALETSVVPARVAFIGSKALLVLAIASVTVTLARIATGMIRANAERLETTVTITSLTDNATRVIIFLIGSLLIVNSLGISVVPILATLGVAGLAVGLALQDTFGNFFAGFHIILSKQIRINDYVRLDSGVEGYVYDINWRTTQIKTLAGNLVLVPNLKLTQAVITDFCLPQKEVAVTVEVSVRPESDLEKVQMATEAVASETASSMPGSLPGQQPKALFTEFSEYGVKLSVTLKCREFTDQYSIRHELIKRLHARYNKEGIFIAFAPFPVGVTRK
ncbi:MAG: mechanosensitive ion channel family protein [Deltaproteobacteria bacterium]